MKLLVAGYPQDETRRLSERLREEGHQVLGAVGRHGARTFVKVVTPDCVLVPAGEDGERVRGWLEELGVDLRWVAVEEGEDPVAALERFRAGAGRSGQHARPQGTPAEAILEVDPVASPARRGPITDTFDSDSSPVPRSGRRVAVGSPWPGSAAPEPVAPQAPLERRPVAPTSRSGARQVDDTPEAGDVPTTVDPVVLSRFGVEGAQEPEGGAPPGPATAPDARAGAAPAGPSRSGQLWVTAGRTVVPTLDEDPPPEVSGRPRGRQGGASSEEHEPARVKVPTGNVAAQLRRRAAAESAAPRRASALTPWLSAPLDPVEAATPAPATSADDTGPPSQRVPRPAPEHPAELAVGPRADREITAPGGLGLEAPRDGNPADAELVSKLAQARFGDYHSILELEPDASPYVVREQFKRLSNLYSPRGWPKKLGPEELAMLSEIGRSIRDASLILGDPELRARYERALIGAPASRRVT